MFLHRYCVVTQKRTEIRAVVTIVRQQTITASGLSSLLSSSSTVFQVILSLCTVQQIAFLRQFLLIRCMWKWHVLTEKNEIRVWYVINIALSVRMESRTIVSVSGWIGLAVHHHQVPILTNLFQMLLFFCRKSLVFANSYVKLHIFSQFCFL